MSAVMREVPFYGNHEDNNHCMVAIYRSLFEYFLNKKYSWEEMDEFVGYKDHRAAWTLAPLTKMVELGFDIRMIEPFDYRKYLKRGEDYIYDALPADKADWLLEHSNIRDIQPYIPAFLRTVRWENRPATTEDIDAMLTDGRLVFVTLNARALNGQEGYVDHAVLIIGREGRNYIAHDPGPKPQADRRIDRDTLYMAMGGDRNTSEVTGFKLQSKAGKRLDQYVVSERPRLSRAFIQKLCDDGQILVNGKPAKPGFKLRDSDVVTVNYDESILDTVPDIDLPVLYEDAECVVIIKPAGVLTHVQGEFVPEATVASFLKNRGKDIAGERAGIVHRLDRATSGVMIGAKTQHALQMLQQQFADREAHKTYIAVVQGRLKQPEAVIDMPIERNPKAPATHRVGTNGKNAITQYKVLQETDKYSLVELYPKTGRTHQLRVHLAHLGHPIVGDPLYGKGKYGDRLYLHAAKLELTLPDGERRTFEAPLPAEFREIMQ
jgi:23S rRNA pseudouridine1911/1915/1917 synthase